MPVLVGEIGSDSDGPGGSPLSGGGFGMGGVAGGTGLKGAGQGGSQSICATRCQPTRKKSSSDLPGIVYGGTPIEAWIVRRYGLGGEGLQEPIK